LNEAVDARELNGDLSQQALASELSKREILKLDIARGLTFMEINAVGFENFIAGLDAEAGVFETCEEIIEEIEIVASIAVHLELREGLLRNVCDEFLALGLNLIADQVKICVHLECILELRMGFFDVFENTLGFWAKVVDEGIGDDDLDIGDQTVGAVMEADHIKIRHDDARIPERRDSPERQVTINLFAAAVILIVDPAGVRTPVGKQKRTGQFTCIEQALVIEGENALELVVEVLCVEANIVDDLLEILMDFGADGVEVFRGVFRRKCLEFGSIR